MQASLVVDCRNTHGEGVFWNELDRRIWWTDIEGSTIWSFDPESEEARCHEMPDRVCCFAPRASGGLIVAFADRISLYDLETGQQDTLYSFEPDNRATRLNDGRVDRQGRLVVGGMNEGTGASDSSVVRVETDLSVTKLFDNVACANSTCFSPDGGTLYFADTPRRIIECFDYPADDRVVANRRIFADLSHEPGLPDGSCVDAEGFVWNAEWKGGRVVRISPEGEIVHTIEIGVEKPTCCAFGGPDLDILFITTSRLNSSPESLARAPSSGGLYCVRPGVSGLIDPPFAG